MLNRIFLVITHKGEVEHEKVHWTCPTISTDQEMVMKPGKVLCGMFLLAILGVDPVGG